MLNPSLVTDAVAAALRTITALVAAMAEDSARIVAYHYLYGSDEPSVKKIYEMPAPSILVLWEGTQGGNFDGSTIWKHKIAIYIRTTNVAVPGFAGVVGAYEYVWWLICNGVVNGGSHNIRQINLLPQLEIMDTPSVQHMQDEEGQDLFCGKLVIPEIGDN